MRRVVSNFISTEYNFSMATPKKNEIICRCNNVSRKEIEGAIKNGAKTLNEIFDATTAGVGPCGGTCRRKIGPFLDNYIKTGTFPEKIEEDNSDKQDPKKLK
jgi:NAD(P)H-nitrite reductase large subunit